MIRTGLIRLGGLVTMVGGVGSYAIIWLPDWLSMLLLAATIVPAMAALRALHSEHYGLAGTLGSLTVFVGVVLVVASWILKLKTPSVLGLGLVLVTAGLVGLATLTIVARVLPWWCGAALIVGSPLGVVLGIVFLWPFGLDETALILPLGVGWALVGFAIFRAGARQTEQASRVR
jgi:hypothetical protein